MTDKSTQHFLIFYTILILQFINIDFSQGLNLTCSKWNASNKTIIFGNSSNTPGNDDYSLDVTLNSTGLDINKNNGDIAILDGNNGRVIVFNGSNSSNIFVILLNASNSTNFSTIGYPPSSIAYGFNNSLFVSDGTSAEIFRLDYPLDYGINGTKILDRNSGNITSLSSTSGGLCVNNINKSIYIIKGKQIYQYTFDSGNLTNLSYVFNNPQSIVMNDNQSLFVYDAGSKSIKMFTLNSSNGITLPFNKAPVVALSVYSVNILVITASDGIYLFDIMNNNTICALKNLNSSSTVFYNAIIDHNDSLIVSESNTIVSYPIYQECPEITTQITTETPTPTSTITKMTTPSNSTGFNPTDNCPSGYFGFNCSFSKNICIQTDPCLNDAHCNVNNQTNSLGYSCNCSMGYNGTQCQNDYRLCKNYTCFARGNCSIINDVTFACNCSSGYTGEHCELSVDYCANVVCQNQGVCVSENLKYLCQCLSGFYGEFCEKQETSAVVRAYATKSLGFVAVLMICSIIGFILSMDLLKYVLKIDPVKTHRYNIRKARIHTLKKTKEKVKPKCIQRVSYVP
ncbi:unnamed protein product [Adineta ricciae]|uniref:EGF-like domain-containing protein n=1 Tax=Adineta ricciae TaxID=249248 RepID=A0A814ZUZ4_ADIRI|nr:unnamed protein product [Adineta ricciae]CAF1248527.1 unnamed protein product [Adineta ricciae]